MARTLTGNNRRREQRLQSLMLDRLVVKYERRVAREIARAMRSGAAAFEAGEPIFVAEQAHHARMTRIMTTVWTDSARSMSEHILGTQKAMSAMEIKRDTVQPTVIMDSVMHNWIRIIGTEKITQITNTTQKDIRRIINQGVAQGLSEREIGRAIRDIAPTKSASRAQTIARTETHAASQAAAQASAEAVDLQMVRVWVSAQGERTREDHAQADGQVRGMHEPFQVGGESLMFPGDPGGSPEQVVNCRCCVVYELE